MHSMHLDRVGTSSHSEHATSHSDLYLLQQVYSSSDGERRGEEFVEELAVGDSLWWEVARDAPPICVHIVFDGSGYCLPEMY